MSHEERVPETLPCIIKSLAQQVVTRDAQIKSEQTKFHEELASLRNHKDLMQAERDNALRSAEGVALERDRFKEQGEANRAKWMADVERVRSQYQKELAQEKTLSAKLRADCEIEKTGFTAKIVTLEQVASRQSVMLAQAQREAEDWKNQYEAISGELRRRTDQWVEQFARVASSLEELSTARTNSQSGSSPTVVAPYETAISNIFLKKGSPFKDCTQRSRVIRPAINNSPQTPSKMGGTACHPSSIRAHKAPTKLPNSEDTRQPKVHQVGESSSSLALSQGKQGAQPQGNAIYSPKKSSSFSDLPPDRVIITAHYEIKKEDDEDNVEPSLSDIHLYPGTLGPGVSPKDDPNERQDGPVSKRRRTTAWRQSTRKIIQDDDDEGNQPLNGNHRIEQSRRHSQDDFDEMAIGAEDNHKEVYGHRRVNVREVNVKPRTPPPRRSPRRTASQSGGLSSRKRKAGTAITAALDRPTTAKKR